MALASVMQTYMFQARNIDGNLIVGDMQADNRPSVISALKQRGYFLLSVEQENRLLSILRQQAGLFGGRVAIRERAIFTHQLATLLKAGMQLSTALRTLSKQTDNKYLGSIIGQLYRDIEESSSLSQAMAKYPRVFPPVYTAIIVAAEESGALADSLTNLSKQLKSQASINARIRGAMAYPVFLLAVSAIVLSVLVTFVIPKFMELFINAHQKLPLPTQILVTLTNFIKEFWWALPLVIVGLVCAVIVLLRQEQVRIRVDGLLLSMPLVGTLNRKLQLARFARTLGSLLKGGVRILVAIHITKGTTANRAFGENISSIADHIMKGTSLAKAVGEQSCFNEITANMIAVGEDSGMLPEMLLEVAEMYEQESEAAINSVTNLLGPMMIVVLGFIIGFVVLAILLPIFETSTMVG